MEDLLASRQALSAVQRRQALVLAFAAWFKAVLCARAGGKGGQGWRRADEEHSAHHSQLQGEQRNRIDGVSLWRCTRLLLACLRAWRQLCLTARRASHHTAVASARLSDRLLAKSFSRWTVYVTVCCYQQQITAKALQARRRRMQGKTLAVWHHLSQQRIQASEQACHRQAMHRRRHLLQAWGTEAKRRTWRRAQLGHAVQRRWTATSRTALQLWHAYSRGRAYKVLRHRAAQHHFCRRLARTTMAAWRAHASVVELEESASQLWAMRLRTRCLRAWQTCCREAAHVEQQWLAAREQALMASAFQALARHWMLSSLSRVSRAACARRTLVHSFLAWRAAVSKRQEESEVQELRSQALLVASAWSEWRALVAEQCERGREEKASPPPDRPCSAHKGAQRVPLDVYTLLQRVGVQQPAA